MTPILSLIFAALHAGFLYGTLKSIQKMKHDWAELEQPVPLKFVLMNNGLALFNAFMVAIHLTRAITYEPN